MYVPLGYSFFAVAVHELGHSLGLTHVENRQSIMFPFYQRLESNFELHPYDRWLIQNIFGERYLYSMDPVS